MPEPIRPEGPLTLAFVRRLRTPGRYHDGNGLFLTVTSTGSKHWTQRLTIHGRRQDIGLGSAIIVTPTQARKAAEKNKLIALRGGNPLARTPEPKREAGPAVRRTTFAGWSATVYRKTLGIGTRNAKQDYGRIRLHSNPVT